MKRIIGYVKVLKGTYKAESKDGTVRILKHNDPIYEDDAVFGANDPQAPANLQPSGNNGSDGNIQTGVSDLGIELNDGKEVHISEAGYLLFDSSVMGKDFDFAALGLGDNSRQHPIYQRHNRQGRRGSGNGQENGNDDASPDDNGDPTPDISTTPFSLPTSDELLPGDEVITPGSSEDEGGNNNGSGTGVGTPSDSNDNPDNDQPPSAEDTFPDDNDIPPTVENPPEASSATIETTEGNGPVPLGLVPPNDLDGDTLTITITQLPLIGIITLADGTPVSIGDSLTSDQLTGLKYVVPSDYDNASDPGDFVYTVTDGISAPVTGTVDINIAPVNDPPIIDLDGDDSSGVDSNGYQATYVVGAHSTPIADTDILITDVDDANIESATIVLTNAQEGDALVTSGVPADFAITNTGIVGGQITVTLTKTDTKGSFADAIKAIEISNSLDAPDLTDRVINVTVNDGDNDSNTAVSIIHEKILHIDLDSDDSTGKVGADYTAAFTEGETGVSIADIDTTITDNNDTHMESATIVLTNAQPGDVLDTDGVPAGFVVTNTGIVDGKVTVTLTATETKSNYAQAIETIKFTNGLDNPDTTDRVIHVTVNDGIIDSNIAVSTISVTGTNDIPIAENDATSIQENAVVPLTGTILTNDLDVDGDTLVVSEVNGVAGNVGSEFAGSYGTVTVNPDGTYEYVLDNANQTVENLQSGDTLTETFTYTVSDGNGGTDTATLTITINGTNDSPVAVNDTNIIIEDAVPPVTGTVLTNDSDVEGDTIVVSQLEGVSGNIGNAFSGSYGTVTVNSDGTYTYSLDNGNSTVQGLKPGETITDTFTYAVSDGKGGTDTGTLTITIKGTNDVPVAVNDTGSIIEDAGVSVTGNVLTNDSDIDGDTLVVSELNGAAGNVGSEFDGSYGTITVNSDGTYSYSLDNTNTAVQGLQSGQTITDTFTYKISDGNGGTDTATLTITINGTDDAPVAVNDTNSIAEDTVAPVTGTVLANDSDVEGDTIVVSEVNGAAGNVGNAFAGSYGTVTLNSDGTYSYALDNSNNAVQALGPGQTINDTFTYTISDGNGGTDTATLTITINGTADAPVAVNDTSSITEDAVAPVTGTVLANDSDVEGDALSVTLVVSEVNGVAGNIGNPLSGSYGTVTVNSDGTYTYSLDNTNTTVQALHPGQTITDTFTYTVSDGDGGTDTATLTITINGSNDQPVAVSDINSITEDTVATLTGTVLANDSDVDGDTIVVSELNGFAGNVGSGYAGDYGTVTVNSDGTYSYALDNSNATVQGLQSGETITDIFNYTISDGNGGTDMAALTITIHGTNDLPIAVNDTNAIIEGSTVPVIGTVVPNDYDVDGDTLVVSEINGVAGNVGNPLSGSYGTVTVNSDGTYSYSLDNTNGTVQGLRLGDTITDTFTYNISDGRGGTDTATLTISIYGTDVHLAHNNPTAVDDANSITEDTIAPLNGTVITNDSDPDNDALIVSEVNGVAGKVGTSFAGSYGTVTLNADGSYSYALDNANTAVQGLKSGDTITDEFSYTVSDGNGGTDTATLTITINGTEDAPVAVRDANSITEDTVAPVTGTVITNDLDVDGGPLVVTDINGVAGNVGNPLSGSYGTVTINSDGTYSYSLDNTNAAVQGLKTGETVTDIFNYSISDGRGGTDITTLTITINGTDDVPVAVNDTNSTAEDVVAPVTGTVLVNDYDVDGDPLVVTDVNGVAGNVGNPLAGSFGTVTVNSDGTYSYSLDNTNATVQGLKSGETIADTFTYKIDDGNGGTDTATLTITINGTEDVPVAVNDTNSITEDTVNPVTGTVLTNDSDVDGDTLVVSELNGAAGNVGSGFAGSYGTVTVNSDGTYSYVLDNANSTVQGLQTGETITDTFTYTVDDGHGGSDTATLTITINGTADAPIAHNDTTSIAEDTVAPVTGTVLTNDSDVDGDTLVVTELNGVAGNVGSGFAGSYGTVTVNSDGTYSYTLDNANATVQALKSGQTINDTFTYTISDGNGGSDTATLTITINGTNDVPVAVNDANSITEDTVPPVTGFVLTNDSDVEGDTLVVTELNGAAGNVGSGFAGSYGTVTVNSDGSYSYSLDNTNTTVQGLQSGESITDAFTYTISDGNGGTDTATLTITINGTNDAPVAVNDTSSITENTVAPVTGTVFTNDSDIDGDTIVVTSLNGVAGNVGNPLSGSYGTVTLNSDGTYSYALDNANTTVEGLQTGETLTETFTYVISDGNGGTDTATLTITINGTNDAPVIDLDGNDSAGIGSNGYQTTFTENGTAVAIADIDSLITDVDDTNMESATIVLDNAKANDALDISTVPAGFGAIVNTSVPGKITVTLTGTHTNADYADAIEEIKFSNSSENPDTTDRVIKVTVNDGNLDSNTAVSTIHVTPVNDIPVADSEAITVAEESVNTPLGLTAPTDVDGDTLTITISGLPTLGTVTLADGTPVNNGDTLTSAQLTTLQYDAPADYDGVADPGVFTYTVTDGNSAPVTGTVDITLTPINDSPVGVNETDTVTENTAVAATGNVISNDTDVDNTTLTVSAFQNGDATSGTVGTASSMKYGTMTLNSNGSYSYVVDDANSSVNALNVGETLTETITYTVSDGSGGSDTATLTITINGANDAPTIDLDSSTVGNNYSTSYTENTGGVAIANGDSLISDVDDANIQVATITLKDAEALDDLDISGATSLGFTAVKQVVGDDIVVTLTKDDTKSNFADGIEAVKFINTSEDPVGGDRTIEIKVDDGHTANHESNIATTTVTVIPVNDAPIGVNETDAVTEDAALAATGNVISNDTDVDNTSLTVSAFQNGDATSGTVGTASSMKYGTMTLNSNGSYSYVVDDANSTVNALNVGETLTETITYTVIDGSGGSDTATLTITINGANDAPTIDLDSSTAGNNYSTSYTENTGGVAIANGDSLISDVDDANIQVATITLKDAEALDDLDISGATALGFTAVKQVVGDDIVVTLTKDDTKSNFADGIEAVKFINTSEDPVGGDRTIEIKVDDGHTANHESNIATTTVNVIPVNDAPVTNDVVSDGDKDDTYIAITLTGSDVDSNVSHFKVTSNPPEGTLYTDAALTNAVVIGSDIAATGNELTLYFKPDYGASNTYGPNNYTDPTGAADSVSTFTYEAKDADSSDGVTYGNSATATITVDDVPYANDAIAKDVVENMAGATSENVGGNVLTDGADFANGIDYQSTHEDGPSTVKMVQFTNAAGDYNSAVAITTGTPEGGGYAFTADNGKLVIHADGTYTFTPNGSMDHAASGDDLEFKFKYAIEDSDGDLSNYAEQVINIQDGAAPTIGTTVNSTVDEENLALGTAPNADALTQTGTLDVTTGTDAVDVVFDATQAVLDAKIAAGLSSGGNDINYVVSPDGHKITAFTGATADTGNNVFTVEITDPDNSDDPANLNVTGTGYTFTLIKPIDHESAVNNGDDGGTPAQDLINFEFGVIAQDDDDATANDATGSFVVTVVDDSNGGTQSVTTNEHSAINIITSADATDSNTSVTSAASHGTAVMQSDGTVTYTPNGHYSGEDTFTYMTTNDSGGSDVTVVTVTVTPVADTPTWAADKTGINELSTNEDTLVSLGLLLPNITDHTDQNGGSGAGNDETEHLGLVVLSGVPTGVEIFKSDGATLVWRSDGTNLKIRIDDNGTGTWNSSDLHYKGISGEDVVLTSAEFAALKLMPKADSGTDITGITLTTTSFEVNDDGTLKAGPIESAEATQTINIDVQAVTDTVTITKTGDASGTEDGWIRIDNKFTTSHTDSSDGSEKYTFKVDSADLGVGAKYRVNGGTEQDASSGINVANWNGTDAIEIMTAPNDSNDINDLTITVELKDTDIDPGSGATSITSDSIDINVDVVPVANDITLSGGGSGNEDTKIDMGLTFSENDGNEAIQYITIAGSSIPDGAQIFASDANGGGLLFTGDGSTDFIIDIAGSNPADENINDTLVNVSGYKIQPPLDSNADIPLDVTIHTKDFDDDTSTEEVTGSVNKIVNIEVIGVVDTRLGNHDTADAGHLYVELDNALVIGDNNSTTILTNHGEDSEINLRATWQSYEARTDGIEHGTASSDSSETATFIIRNVTDSTDFIVTDGSGNQLGTRSYDGWHLTEAEIGSAHIKAIDNFSGVLQLELETTVTESGDDSTFDVNTQVDKFQVTINPVTDTPSVIVREVFTKEDTPIKLDIRPISADMDDSEDVVSIKIDDIPDGAVIKNDDGETLFVNDTGASTSHTFAVDTGEVTQINNVTPAVNNGANTTSTVHGASELEALWFTPPAHSSGDIELVVTSTMKDGIAASASSAPETLTVHVQGVADAPVLQLEDKATLDAEVGIKVNGVTIADDGTPTTFNDGDTVVVFGQERTDAASDAIPIALPNLSGETAFLDMGTTPAYSRAGSDTSETLSFLLSGVPSDFRIVDSGGNLIGGFVSLAAGKTTWALSATEVSNGVYLKAPVDYSGNVTGLNFTSVVTEADGHSTTRDMPFTLEVNPVITTVDAAKDVTGLEDAAPDGTEHGSLINLDFTNVLDKTGSEIVTNVEITDANIPDGLELYVDTGTNNWVLAKDLGIYNGSVYDLTNYVGKTAVGVVGATLEHVAGTYTITGVNITVTDGNENGNATIVTKDFTDNISVTLTGVADQPEITAASATSGLGNVHDVSITTIFPDMDGSESHYLTIQTPDATCKFNKGTMVDANLWRFDPSDLTGLQVEVTDGSTSTLIVKAYAEENGIEVDTATLEVVDTMGGAGGGGSAHTAQAPTLTLEPTHTSNEDAAFVLSDVINSGATQLNNSDGGTEVLSFIVRDLPENASIVSNSGSVSINEVKDANGDTVYIIKGGTAQTMLDAVSITPPADFSGDFTFTAQAVATETDRPFYDGVKEGSTGNITVHVSPVADALAVDSSAMIKTIAEDAITQVKFEVSTSDSTSDVHDTAEEIYYAKDGAEDIFKVSLSGDGSLVYSDGTQIEGDNDILVKLDGGVAKYNNGGTWEDVFFKGPDQEAGSYGINVTAKTYDSTDFSSTSPLHEANISADQTQIISITVTPDPDAADEADDPNEANDILTAADVATTEDTAIQLNISVTNADNDSSELHAIVITGLVAGSTIQDNTGAIIGTNNGDGSWTVASSDLGNLYLLPPGNYSGTMDLNVENRVIETDDMSQASTTSDTFTVTVTPIADGAITTPHKFGGVEDAYIHVELEAESIEASQNASSAITGTPVGDEHFNITFSGINEDAQFYWKDGSNVYHHLTDENSGNVNDYVIENITQEQIDEIYVVIGDNLTGTFNYDTAISTVEVDVSNNVLGTASALVTGRVEINVIAVLGDDSLNGSNGDDILYGRSGNDIINGDSGNDIINGGSGNDIIDGGNGADNISGGTGNDTITFDATDIIDAGSDVFGSDVDTLILGTGTNITFDAGAIAKLSNIEQIDLSQNGNHSLDNLSINDLINITDADNELTILGDAGDSVEIVNGDGGSWVHTGTSGGFNVYDLNGDANALTLKVDEDIILTHTL